MLEQALDYLQRGFSIFPLKPKSKYPLTDALPLVPDKDGELKPSWKPFQEAPPTVAQVTEWWTRWPDANIAIITGAVSGLIVLDIDGPEGKIAMQELSLVPPMTHVVKTGKGAHFYMRHPGAEVRNFAGRLPKVDLRGDGGYVCAPPSVHPNGGTYEWLRYDKAELPEVPQWIFDLAGNDPRPRQGRGGDHGPGINPAEVLAGVGEGGRDVALFKYACRLREKGYDRAEAETLVVQAGRACSPPFPEADALKKVESAWRYEPGQTVTEDDKRIVMELPARLKQDPKAIFEPEVIGALATVKQQDPAEWGALKLALGKEAKGLIRDVEKAINKTLADRKKLRVVQADEQTQLSVTFDDIPTDLKEIKVPASWTVNEKGVLTWTEQGPVWACPVPVLLTKRLRNVDTNEEKIELVFKRDRAWHRITADRTTVFSRTAILQLANRGLPVTSESAKDLVKYLGEVEAENMTSFPIIKSTGHMGWVGNNFLPGAEGDILLDIDDGGMRATASAFTEEGTLEGWIANMAPIRDKHKLARFLLASSFSAPLLKLVGSRVFLVHIWGPSRGGKTAGLKGALSVWGEPEGVMASFNATKVALERLAGLYSDLPLGVDERQVVGDRQGFVESLVYMLGMGKGKARGSKAGGLQAWQSWRSIVLTTGEEPLSTDSSTAGIKTRAVEVYGLPFSDEADARFVHNFTRVEYGTAGPVFIRRLLAELEKDPGFIDRDFADVTAVLLQKFGDKLSSHLQAIATILLGDMYASQWIFGKDEHESAREALELADLVFNELESQAEADDGVRAWDYFRAWYGMNAGSFREDTPGPRYGFLETADSIYVFPPIFERALRDGGFSPNRILRDWSTKGIIATEERAGENRRRMKVRKADPKTGQMTYFIKVNFRDPELPA